MTHSISKLNANDHVTRNTIASSTGKGSDKSLIVVTIFNGKGFANTTFHVVDHDNVQEFYMFDKAVDAYNEAA